MKMELVKLVNEFFIFHPTDGNIGTTINLGRGGHLIMREQALNLVNDYYRETTIYKSRWVIDVDMNGDQPKLIDGYLNILSIIE